MQLSDQKDEPNVRAPSPAPRVCAALTSTRVLLASRLSSPRSPQPRSHRRARATPRKLRRTATRLHLPPRRKRPRRASLPAVLPSTALCLRPWLMVHLCRSPCRRLIRCSGFRCVPCCVIPCDGVSRRGALWRRIAPFLRYSRLYLGAQGPDGVPIPYSPYTGQPIYVRALLQQALTFRVSVNSRWHGAHRATQPAPGAWAAARATTTAALRPPPPPPPPLRALEGSSVSAPTGCSTRCLLVEYPWSTPPRPAASLPLRSTTTPPPQGCTLQSSGSLLSAHPSMPPQLQP